jgi:dihydroflavonol-4-reductase
VRVLLTGATGFLGSHLAKRLVSLGYDTAALHRKQSNAETLSVLGVHPIPGDFDNLRCLRDAVAGHDLVIHAAADIRGWAPDPGLQLEANVGNTQRIAKACRLESVGRLIHVSSVSAIGIPGGPACPADENFAFNLRGRRFNYHLSKKQAEDAVLREVADGLDAVIVNPGSIFGPHGSRYRGAEIIRKVSRGKIVTCFNGGRCIVHVEDVVDGILSAIRNGVCGDRYILGGDNVSFREIARRASAAMGLHPLLLPVPSFLAAAAVSIGEAAQPGGQFMPRLAALYNDCLFQYYVSDRAVRVLGFAPRKFTSVLEECLAFGRLNKLTEA